MRVVMSILPVGSGIPIVSSFISSSESKALAEEVRKLIFKHGSKTIGHHGPFQRDDLPPVCASLAPRVAQLLAVYAQTGSVDVPVSINSTVTTSSLAESPLSSPTSHWNTIHSPTLDANILPFMPNQVDIAYILPGGGYDNVIEQQQETSTPSVTLYILGNAMWDIIPQVSSPNTKEFMVSFPNKAAAIFNSQFTSTYMRSLPFSSLSRGLAVTEESNPSIYSATKTINGLRVMEPIADNAMAKSKGVPVKRSPYICITFRRFESYKGKPLSIEEYNAQMEQQNSVSNAAPVQNGETLKVEKQTKITMGQKLKAKVSDAVDVSLDALSTQNASKFEQEHVVAVYDVIAPHFSGTRYQAWPQVDRFVNGLASGSFLADVGCGNGKYLGLNPNIITSGCDISIGLTTIAYERGYNVCVADALAVPYRSALFDAAICIAVLHHLSTEARRVEVLEELLRIVCCGGRVLVTAWAYEQEQDSARVFASEDVWVSWKIPDNIKKEIAKKNAEKQKLKRQHGETRDEEAQTSAHDTANINANRDRSDQTSVGVDMVNVPDCVNRYYHVFRKGEMEALVDILQQKRQTLREQVKHGEISRPQSDLVDVFIEKSFYDKGNWCIILQKAEA